VAQNLGSIAQYAEPLSGVEGLGQGDRVTFREGSWEVLHTPGHARGALCLWEPGHRQLLSGDTLIGHISSNALLEPDPTCFRKRTLLEYRASLERIRGLAPLWVGPGHGAPVEEGGVEPLLAGRFSFYERRARAILTLVGEGLRRPWQVAARLFPDLPPEAAFLAVSEVVGFLDLLAERGEVAFEGQEEGEGWVASKLGT
jgi:glyoxylase-like metal-dependent hydrolase (beta-lactamase superfamily II)